MIRLDRQNGISMKKKLRLVVVLLVAVYIAWNQSDRQNDSTDLPGSSNQALADAFQDRKSGVQVKGNGAVVKVLPDDNVGSRHQRFILRLPSGQTLVVAHNIDLAPRISSLREGDAVAFHGEYEWNPKGGVVHWTHRDPNGRHVAGWLKHRGRTYQ